MHSLQVRVHRTAGHRRGDPAAPTQQLGRDDGGGGGGVAPDQERDPRQLELSQCLLHGRDAGAAPAGRLPERPRLPAHDAARLPQCELHQAGPVRQVLP